LEGADDVGVVQFFNERRLRPVTRMSDAEEQRNKLNELLEEFGEKKLKRAGHAVRRQVNLF
jgi:hypothetical protein